MTHWTGCKHRLKVVELSEKIAELDEAIMQRMERDRKEIDRLLRALQAKDEKIALYEGALEVACEETENLLKDRGVKACVICWFTEPARDCDEDCGECLKKYFMERAKEG